MMKYIVEHDLVTVYDEAEYASANMFRASKVNTVGDLHNYLNTDPHPEYRLVSCQFTSTGKYELVWERKE